MLTVRQGKRRHPERRLRKGRLRAFHFVRRHHFSLISVAILSAVLAIALTDAGFRRGSEPRAQAAREATTGALPQPSGPAGPGEILYYIADSPEQIDMLSTAIRGDSRYFLEQGAPGRPRTWAYFLLFATPEQEANGARLLNEVAEMVPYEGLGLRVVDLTR